MANSIDTGVYVDTASLEMWASKMATINAAALDDLNGYLNSVKELVGNSYEGSSAQGFLNANKGFINKALSNHEKMESMPTMLREVIEAEMNL